MFPDKFFVTNLFRTSFVGKVGLKRSWNLFSSTVVMFQLLTVITASASHNFNFFILQIKNECLLNKVNDTVKLINYYKQRVNLISGKNIFSTTAFHLTF